MQIQVNTDNHIKGSTALTHQVEAVVEGALARFSEWITRVEVHLSDENGGAKTGTGSLRCVMEARLASRQPVGVSHQAASIGQACGGAAGKLERMLESTLGRLNDPKANPSPAGEPQA